MIRCLLSPVEADALGVAEPGHGGARLFRSVVGAARFTGCARSCCVMSVGEGLGDPSAEVLHARNAVLELARERAATQRRKEKREREKERDRNRESKREGKKQREK